MAAGDIIKIFHEEPFYLDTASEEDERGGRRSSTESSVIDALLPGDFSEREEGRSEDEFSEDALQRTAPLYRLYVAGTDLASKRVGATAIRKPLAWAAALADVFAATPWWVAGTRGPRQLDDGEREDALIAGDPPHAIVVADHEPFAEPLADLASRERDTYQTALRRILEDGRAVLMREPAHHGHDWSIFAAGPVRERLEGALASRLPDSTRAFSAPYARARSEERFYFEQWALDDLPTWASEIRLAKGP